MHGLTHAHSKENSQADEMFFLIRGSAGIYYGTKLIVVIEEGSYFGEIGCIMGGIRRAGVKALETCELQALSRRNLNILLGEYPEVGDELKRVARDRAKAKKESTSDKEIGETTTSDDRATSRERTSDSSVPPTNGPPPPTTSSVDEKVATALVDVISQRVRDDLLKSIESVSSAKRITRSHDCGDPT